MEECLDGQSDGVVVGWLGKMLLPGVFRVHEVVTGTFEQSFRPAKALTLFRMSLDLPTLFASTSHEHEGKNEGK
jgi:hypothetical protein